MPFVTPTFDGNTSRLPFAEMRRIIGEHLKKERKDYSVKGYLKVEEHNTIGPYGSVGFYTSPTGPRFLFLVCSEGRLNEYEKLQGTEVRMRVGKSSRVPFYYPV